MELKEERLCSNCKHYAGRDQIFGPCDKHEVTIVACNASCPSWRPMTILRDDCENDENAAWELAKAIGLATDEGGMTYDEICECFGLKEGAPTSNIYRMSYKEAREKYVSWTRSRARRLYVGDEVVVRLPKTKPFRMIITKEYDLNDAFYGIAVYGISANGEVYIVDGDTVERTGRHFDNLKYMLANMFDEEDHAE